MKFINLDTMTIETISTYRTFFKLLGPVDDLFDLSISEFKTKLEKILDIRKEDIEEDAVLFEIGVENAELEDFEYLVNVIVDILFNLNTLDEQRNRTYRLAVPTELMDVHCNDVPLRKAVNNKCLFDKLAIRIYDLEKGWEYKIVD